MHWTSDHVGSGRGLSHLSQARTTKKLAIIDHTAKLFLLQKEEVWTITSYIYEKAFLHNLREIPKVNTSLTII